MQVLCHELKHLLVCLLGLLVADSADDLFKFKLEFLNSRTYPESVHEFVEWEAVVLRWLGNGVCGALTAILVMSFPEFLVFEHNLFQIFKRDYDWVNLAQFAQLEKFNGADFLSVSGEVCKY